MINRQQVESILRVNGMKPTAPDEHIRSVLLSARYNHDEVDTAIMILRENQNTNKSQVDGLHKIFRTDQTLQSNEISALLGVDVTLRNRNVSFVDEGPPDSIPFLSVAFLSICLASFSILLYMYLAKVGPFYVSAAGL